MRSTLIKNAHIVTSTDEFAGAIHIKDGRIDAIGPDVAGEAGAVIDAKGRLVMPGGVDVHTHFTLDTGVAKAQDDFYTGTVAAACGGTTCIVDHPGFGPDGCDLHHQLNMYQARAKGRAVIDYGLHGVLQRVDDAILDELNDLVAQGYPSAKVYMTYAGKLGDDDLAKVLARMRLAGGLTAVHAEDDEMLVRLRRQMISAGQTDVRDYAASRPDDCEAEGVRRVLHLAARAGDAPVYIVHLSTARGLAHIRAARARGQRNIFVETCPQYLLLDDACYRMPDREGLKYVMAPPVRAAADRDALWQGLADGAVEVVATDHCPFDFAKKMKLGRDDFTRCPGGIPGVETRMALLFSEGVTAGRISRTRFVQVTATRPAQIMGMYPQKGDLLPGADADLVIFDPGRRVAIDHGRLHQNVDYTPYEGMTVRGWPVLTMVRGRVVAREGEFVGAKGFGRFVARKLVPIRK